MVIHIPTSCYLITFKLLKGADFFFLLNESRSRVKIVIPLQTSNLKGKGKLELVRAGKWIYLGLQQ